MTDSSGAAALVMARAPRIALLGGTFDPPHLAHLALAHAALTALPADEVRWIPAGEPWQKMRPGARAITPAVHRVAMVEAAITGAGGDRRFTLDRIEVERSGPSYTLDTVKALAEHEPGREWILVMGADQYAGLHTWHGWRDLLARVTLPVATRPGAETSAPAPEVQAHPHRVVPLPMLDVSAAEIRRRAGAGIDITDLVPAEVAGYIARHGLYRHPGRG